MFTQSQVIRREDAVHHVWGDTTSGFVTDRVVSSTDQLHVLEFELPPGSEFRHSETNQTIFAADVLYYVLEGELILANPQTGEVVRADAGSGRLFHAATWHNGFNPGQRTVRVLEFFSPPPSRGTASEYARRQPALPESHYLDRRWHKRWPAASAERDESTTFHLAHTSTALLAFRDTQASHLLSIIVDTDYLRVVEGVVQPGHVEDFEPVEQESVLVVIDGELWVDVWSPETMYNATTVLRPGDAMFLAVGSTERVLVRSTEPARYLRGSGEVPADWTL